ncbi:MAG TPA: MBL fold metallo-hydrolase [Gemmatimonadaceae bacterium]|nr:MBL fold metallo-hydrolase [Gemmatimonadaceae bacterium]
MIGLETYGDVTRVHMYSAVSDALGYSVSAYLMRGALIDVGFPSAARELAQVLDKLRPEGVLLTHHHEDHAGNVELVARGGVPIAAAQSTIDALRAHSDIGLYRRVVWGRRTRFTSPISYYSSETLSLVPTPGHSHDHHIVWDRESGTVFAGDLFLGVKVRMAHHDENPRQLVDSLRAVARLGPDRMFDGHRGLVPDAKAKLIAKADWLDETIARIEQRADEGWSDRAITREVLGREEAEYYVSLADLSRINLVRQVRLTRAANA